MNLSCSALVFVMLARASAVQAGGDAANGQTLYESRCIGCHSIDRNRVGPAHQGVFGRPAGSAPDYEYSDAVKHSRLVWTAQNLDRWLRNPEMLIPGQKMGYSVNDAEDRADLIAYLKSVSESRNSPSVTAPTEGGTTPP